MDIPSIIEAWKLACYKSYVECILIALPYPWAINPWATFSDVVKIADQHSSEGISDCKLLTCKDAAEVTTRRSDETSVVLIIRVIVIVYSVLQCSVVVVVVVFPHQYPDADEWRRRLKCYLLERARRSLARAGAPWVLSADSPVRRITDLRQRPTARSFLAASAPYMDRQAIHELEITWPGNPPAARLALISLSLGGWLIYS